ncbi:hypothetical protein H0B56_09890 [Haloechinothrix sp. YIM 98757]|uniref:Uncharacterized protein n=1 Tax=Haloechinothrix aidingensis TaxID=2752311 RepID=A0A838AA26_9PSEU|nr:hypothetical protein [Haloechinothrix aidingensis]MBA0125852.1 hypothetical protein [Haloechinothrix aidingensis]
MYMQHNATSRWQRTDIRLATVVAAFASVGAGVIHAAVTPQHWQEWIPAGAFFAGIALFQLAWAGAVLRLPHTPVIGVAIAANLASMALWGASRTWGVPFGPHAGEPEAIGIAGVLAVLFEAIVVLSAAWSLLPRERSAVFAPGAYRFAAAGAAVFVVALTPLGVLSGLEHTHGGPGESHTGSHSDEQGEPAPAPERDTSQEPTPDADTPPSEEPGTGNHEHEDTGHSHD